MKNLERFTLILGDMNLKQYGIRIGLLVLLMYSLQFLSNQNVFALDTCRDCHTNPKYKKEDIDQLKKCLACHGSVGHPYKNISKGIIGSAVAAEKHDNTVVNSAVSSKTYLKEMIYIPDGEFIMGTDDRLRDEKPMHVVYVKSFYIDKYEVTNKSYKEFIISANYNLPDNWQDGNYPYGLRNHPVIFVSWNDADAYCKWRGKRLPREREWEKAARGIDGRIYPWGNKWDLNKSNNPLRGHKGTVEVGSFEAGKSPYGLYDVSGNVWEWVDDYYLPHPGSDFVSPEFGRKYRLLKGGSWWDCSFYSCGISAPVFNRAFFDESTKNDSFGFRCAADATQR